MNRPCSLDEVSGTDHPSTSHASGCKYLPCRVDAQTPILHGWNEGHFRNWFLEHIIEKHSFIHVVFNNCNLRIFLKDVCYLLQLLLSKYFSDWVVRTIDHDCSGFFIQCFLKGFKINIPFVVFIRNNSLLDFFQQLFFSLLHDRGCTFFLGRRGIPMVFPPAIWIWGR